MNSIENPVVVIAGPTASGKTRLAAALANELGAEIISGDSRQVYRALNIGTGKDYQEYEVNGSQIPVHLLDVVDPGEAYHLTAYVEDFYRAYEAIRSRQKLPLLCGGSGLYMEAVLRGFEYVFVPVDMQLREKLEGKSRAELEELFFGLPPTAYASVADTSTAKRLIRAIEISLYLMQHELNLPQHPKLEALVFAIDPPLDERRKRIADRLKARLKAGLVEEVQALMKQVDPQQLIRLGLEYNYVTRYLLGELSFADMERKLTIAIRQFAKRQMTYLRKMEKDGMTIHWLKPDAEVLELKEQVQRWLAANTGD